MDGMSALALGLGLLIGAVLYVAARTLSPGGKMRGFDSLRAQIQQESELRLSEMDTVHDGEMKRLQEEHEKEMERLHCLRTEQEKQFLAREHTFQSQEQSYHQTIEKLRHQEQEIKAQSHALELQKLEMQETHQSIEGRLAEVGEMNVEQARRELVGILRTQVQNEVAEEIKNIETEALRRSKEHTQMILAQAIHRQAADFISQQGVSVVKLPNDEMKGRIIGREGRNIRTLENATGVDILIDDTPEVVVLSSFNPYRRRIAHKALMRLMIDGRIHPAKIDEMVLAAKAELDEDMMNDGEEAIVQLGLTGVHPDVQRSIGALKLREIDGQNLWEHGIETAMAAGTMALEMGIEPMLAYRAGLLHDIGQTLETKEEGAHDDLGAAYLEGFGEDSGVVQAIREHHDDMPETLLGCLVQAADILSKERRGARDRQKTTRIERLQALERCATDIPGVQRAYAMQSGRFLRVMVEAEKVSDQSSLLLCRQVKESIEDGITYPGEIKVTVIRQSKVTEIAV
jgi:ribonucrease Y